MSRKKKLLWAACAICAACSIVCGVYLLRYRMDRNAERAAYQHLRELAGRAESFLRPMTAKASEEDAEIDFEALQEVNLDIYAWIRLPGTGIDYPVLQSSDGDTFYLNHDANREESVSGAIYSEQLNKKDFSDFHTVLYGHDMRDGSMFGSLLLLEERQVMEKNDRILIDLPDAEYEYRIFAVYVCESGHLLELFDQEELLDRIGYLTEIEYLCREVETFDRDVFDTITADSHILTLSTCYHGEQDRRFLVQAVRIEDDGQDASDADERLEEQK